MIYNVKTVKIGVLLWAFYNRNSVDNFIIVASYFVNTTYLGNLRHAYPV